MNERGAQGETEEVAVLLVNRNDYVDRYRVATKIGSVIGGY
jgi:hypothetical protein